MSTEVDQTPMHVVRLLVEGIGQHTMTGDADDCARFRESIKEVSVAIAENVSASELLVRAGSVLQGLEDYTRRAARHQRLQTLELQNMVKMLTSTVGKVSELSNVNISILGEIEKQVAIVSELDDVRVMKAKLSGCLTDIRLEADRQRKETAETIERLNQARVRSAAVCTGDPQDPVTGLPLRPEAEVALAESGRTGCQGYAAVMVLDRLQILNARFGREAGDEILAEFSGMVQKQLTAEDRLYRWGGAVLMALLPRTGSLERARSEVGRLMETRLEHTIQTPSRSILVPIAARWTVFPMMASPRLIFQKIDAFVATPPSRD